MGQKALQAYVSLRNKKQVIQWFTELSRYQSYVNDTFYPRLFELMDKEGLWHERLILSGQLPKHQFIDELSQTILGRLQSCSLPAPLPPQLSFDQLGSSQAAETSHHNSAQLLQTNGITQSALTECKLLRSQWQ